MLRIVLIAAAGCVLLIAVLALTRGGEKPRTAASEPAEVVTSVERVLPPVAQAPAPKAAAPVAPAEPDVSAGQQMEDDAAAVGMTTREPEAEAPAEP